MRIEKVTIKQVDDATVKAMATVRFENGCEVKDVKVVNVGTEYVVGVPWKSTEVRKCVNTGRLEQSARKAVREEVIDEYIYLLARDEYGSL